MAGVFLYRSGDGRELTGCELDCCDPGGRSGVSADWVRAAAHWPGWGASPALAPSTLHNNLTISITHSKLLASGFDQLHAVKLFFATLSQNFYPD